jgi:hypothetical protein
MPDLRVLVIGPSHAGAFQSLLSEGFALPGIEFSVYGIHGAAYRNADFVALEAGKLALKNVTAEGTAFRWFSNQACEAPIDLRDFGAVFLLEPLFLSAGYFKDKMWEQKKGICPFFLSGLQKWLPGSEVTDYVPISSSLWLTVYKEWRPGSIKLIESLRALDKSIPIVVFPPVNPPARLAPGAYAYYYLREQLFLGSYLSETFDLAFFLQPRCTLDEALCTLDAYHRPAPDPHHPTSAYYQLLLQSIDYQTFTIAEPLRWDVQSLI